MTATRPSDAEIEKRRAKYWARIDAEIYDRKTGDKLMPFQREGIEWLGRHPRGILADEQGLGKTVQVLASVIGADAFPCLFICRASLLPTMEAQIKRWTGETPIVMNRADRSSSIRWMKTMPAKFFLAHYEGVVREVDKLREFDWQSVIVDEATDIKNRHAQRSKAVKALRATRTTLLSGTPLLNRPEDLWSLLNALDPATWNSYWRFERRYCIKGGYMNQQVVGYKNQPELKMFVHARMLRRRKDEVLKDLPAKTYNDLIVDLPDWQREIYTKAREEMLVQLAEDKTLTIMSMLARMTRLKQIAVWPQATLGVEEDRKPVKIELLEEILTERDDKKTLVFSKYATVINRLVEDEGRFLRAMGYSVFKFTGSHKDREEDFQSAKSPAVWFATIDAGGMGLTLTAADTVVFLDKDWRPKINEQAEDRTHRIGQKGNVQVISLIARDTIEEYIERVLAKKREMFDSLIEKDGGLVSTRLTFGDLRDMLDA